MEEGLIHFDDVVIDPRAREVRRGDDVVPVQKKVFELLVYLIAHRDRAVGKEELQDRVWPGMIVTETALTRAVMKARRAVGDDSERQAVIRTVHGHGYRFIATLESGAGSGVDVEPGTPPPDREARPVRAWSVVGSVALIALVAVAALLVVQPGSKQGGRIVVLPIEDRTGDPDLAWTGLGLMSYVNRLLSESSANDTVPARKVMAESESLPADPSDEELQALRRDLNASHLIRGTLTRTGDRLTLAYRVVHGQGAGRPASVSGPDATALAQEMARSVISTLPGSGLRREFRTVSDDPFVNEAYARGLSLQLQGEVAKARDFFAVAVRQEPGLFWPRYELALTMRDTGELDAARENLEELVERAAGDTDPDRIAAANNALALVYWRQGDYEGANSAYDAALEAARRVGDPSLDSLILVNRGILARTRGDLDGARRYLASALAAAERSEAPERGSIYQSLGQVEWVAGELPLAMDYYRRAHDEFRMEGDQRSMASALNAMARVERRMGLYADAEEHMQAALEKRETLGDYFGRHSSLISLAELYGEMERWDAAMAHAERALALAEEAAHEPGIADALRVRAAVALAQRDLATAQSDLERLRAELPDDRDEPFHTVLEARMAMLEGEFEEAQELLEPVLRDGPPVARIDALDILAAGAPDMAAARRYWREALDLARANNELGRAGRLLVALTRRELAEGNMEEARSNTQTLVADFGEWPGVVELRDRIGQAQPVN